MSMKILKDEIRPIGFITVEFSEREVEAITGAFEEICYIKNYPFEKMMGTRGEIYRILKKALDLNPTYTIPN